MARPRTRTPRAMKLALWVLRALVAAIVLQFSGVTHDLVDAVHVAEGVAIHAAVDACPYEQQGDDCPPGCPDCHACHGMFAIPPNVERLADVPFDIGQLGLPAYERCGPVGITLSLERPPRPMHAPARA